MPSKFALRNIALETCSIFRVKFLVFSQQLFRTVVPKLRECRPLSVVVEHKDSVRRAIHRDFLRRSHNKLAAVDVDYYFVHLSVSKYFDAEQ